ncbi:MAG: saccharopine dehydrogenase NADP-binding domain-containing protein [Thaumarchaeota archaeon]|nr:saccharopine dehydrogenase NADP-binding domain-containing protein [Nitrososphaerota archaeon]
MKALIVGVGAVGSVIAKHLARSEEVEELIIADKSLERARRVAAETGRRKAVAKRVNALNYRRVAKLAKNVDILINATLPKYNLSLMKACLEAGAHYIDLASDDTDEQIKLNRRFKEQGLTALICMGEDPGLSNILARYGVEQLSKVRSIKIRDCESSIIKGMRTHLTPLYSKEVYFSELSESAYIYQNGRYRRLPPLSGYEEYEFPPPIGRMPVYAVSHEEVFTIPKYIKGVKYVDFKLFIPSDVVQILKVLKVLGLLSKKKVKVDGQEISPAKVLYAVLPDPEELIGKVSGYAGIVVEVEGRRNRRRVKHVLYTLMSHEEAYKEFDTTATAYLTGTPPAVAALMIASGEIRERGVYPPENLKPEPILESLAEYDIVISDLVTEETPITR